MNFSQRIKSPKLGDRAKANTPLVLSRPLDAQCSNGKFKRLEEDSSKELPTTGSLNVIVNKNFNPSNRLATPQNYEAAATTSCSTINNALYGYTESNEIQPAARSETPMSSEPVQESVQQQQQEMRRQENERILFQQNGSEEGKILFEKLLVDKMRTMSTSTSFQSGLAQAHKNQLSIRSAQLNQAASASSGVSTATSVEQLLASSSSCSSINNEEERRPFQKSRPPHTRRHHHHHQLTAAAAANRLSNPALASAVKPTSTATKTVSMSSITIEAAATRREKNKFYDIDEYKMDHPNRGHAIVINNKDFARALNMPARDGTDKDAISLESTLKRLGFDVRVVNNKTASTMKDILLQYAKMDHTNSVNFCIFISFFL